MVEESVLFAASYNGHSVKSSGSVSISFKADYGELKNYVQLIKMLNNDIRIAVKLPEETKGVKLGSFRLKGINIMSDGEGKINFVSTNDFVEVDKLTDLVGVDIFRVMCKAEIDEEDTEEED